MADIIDRVLECFPSGNYALLALLRLVDIVETTEIESAAIECKTQPRMLINPEFVAKHAATPEKLLMLVMHELHHVLLGHTKQFPTVTPEQNFVFDCIINALLSKMFPSPSHTAFFTELYSIAKFPECFLRPPSGWNGKEVTSLPIAIKLCKTTDRWRLSSIYKALYSSTGATYDEIYHALVSCLKKYPFGGFLLGAHGEFNVPGNTLGEDGQHESNNNLDDEDIQNSIDSTNPDLQHTSPEMFEIVRTIVEKWPQPPDPIKGRSLSDLISETDLTLTQPVQQDVALRRLLAWVGSCGTQGVTHELRPVDSPIQSAIPSFARRDLVMRSLGVNSLLFIHSLHTQQRTRDGDKVHVYVDVSASMDGLLESVYNAVRSCSLWVYQTVHLFSTQVFDVSYTDFTKGKMTTTGGTEIQCVAQHIADNHIKRACVVTDGYVGRPHGVDHETLAKTRLGVALTDSSTRSDLTEVANRIDYIGA